MNILVESSGAWCRQKPCLISLMSACDQRMDFYVLSNLIPCVENKDIFNFTPSFFFILTNFYFVLSRTSSYTPVLDNQYSYLYYTLCHIRFCKTRYPRYLFFLYAHSLLFLHCKSNMMFHHKENDLCFIFSTENLNEWINMFLPFFMKILYYLVGMFVFSGRLCLITSTFIISFCLCLGIS